MLLTQVLHRGRGVKNKIVEQYDKKTPLDVINEATSWLDFNQTAEKEEFEEKRKALEGTAMSILQLQEMAGAGRMGGCMPTWVKWVLLRMMIRLADPLMRRLTKLSCSILLMMISFLFNSVIIAVTFSL